MSSNDRDHTVTAVGGVRPGSPLDRLLNHGECLNRRCTQPADTPSPFCAAHRAEAEADQ